MLQKQGFFSTLFLYRTQVKYFYQHKPLRSLEEVAQDILSLEKQADGLIAQILGL